jgi:hydrogenase-4 membrane subunit HyfE
VSSLAILLLGVYLVPLFVGTWRTSLLGLAGQGFLMAWIARERGLELGEFAAWVQLADLVLVRGLAAPLLLRAVLRARQAPRRHDVLPPNLLSWTLALGVVLLAFKFAAQLEREPGQARTLLAVATSGLLLGFLVLATQSGTFGQMVGALRIENALALFELGGSEGGRPALPLQLGQLALITVTVLLFRWYLAHEEPAGARAATPPEAPTL